MICVVANEGEYSEHAYVFVECRDGTRDQHLLDTFCRLSREVAYWPEDQWSVALAAGSPYTITVPVMSVRAFIEGPGRCQRSKEPTELSKALALSVKQLWPEDPPEWLP